MFLINWYQLTLEELDKLWVAFIGFIPRLIGAIIVFLIGWAIAVAVGKLVEEVLKRIKFNKIFEKGSWKTALERAEIKVNAAGFIGAICKWVLLIVFLMAAVKVLGLAGFDELLRKVLGYLPNVVVASFIFVVAVIIADIVEKVIRAAVEGAKVGYGQFAGAIVRWSIWIFAILVILDQLKITGAIPQTIITGVIALIVIAGGLAFGLGGKDIAADILRDLRNKLKG